jgi:hypothetical protein
MDSGKCRISGEPLEPCIDLGDQYVTDFVDRGAITAGEVAPLRVGIGPTSGLAQMFDSFPPSKMYKSYWYRSGTNEFMRQELRSIVESAMAFVRLKKGDTVLDIASNDGTMLSFYPEIANRVGIDPSNVAAESELYGGKITLVNDFFSAGAYRNACPAKAKIVTVIAMFYDLEDPVGFLRGVREIIDDRGLLVIQISYTPLMLEQNEFGNICHEHIFYYTLDPLKTMLEATGFELVDAQMNPTNGGSIRVYATPKGSIEDLACPLNWLSIGRARIIGILEYEKREGLRSPEPYRRFMRRIEELKRQTLEWLRLQADRGKKVIGYGASTKGNVLLQYYGITPELLPHIAEANMKKWGLCTVGTGIPIISETEMRKMKPDYLFVLPWFFISYFMEREKNLLAGGTRFVMPLPQLRVIE